MTNRQRRLPEATKADLVARVLTLDFPVRLSSQPVIVFSSVLSRQFPVRALIVSSLLPFEFSIIVSLPKYSYSCIQLNSLLRHRSSLERVSPVTFLGKLKALCERGHVQCFYGYFLWHVVPKPGSETVSDHTSTIALTLETLSL